jgi:tRNA dimethylallyltransferase
MILAVVGPTGVGKTKLSIALAKKYNAIIINCDAVQVYQELNIGSAKVTKEEKEGIPHYLIDFVNPEYHYTVYDYQKDLRKILSKFKNRNIVIVGGTGLYLKAGLYDYKFSKEDNNETYDNLTNEELYKMALEKDSTCDIHINNRKRLIRFLNRKENSTKSNPLYNAIYIGLTTERSNLYEIINSRVDKMIDNGLALEVKNLLEKYPNSAILNSAIGYKELIKYLNKEISLEEAILEIKKNSRHYAKRQYTWFNNQMNINWFNVNYADFDKTISEVINFIEKEKAN